MKRILIAALFLLLACSTQAAPSKLSYGLIVTGGEFVVATAGTNIPTLNGARILTTNDLGGVGGGGVTGGYSTSALLTIAVSGTNVVGGLSTAIVQTASLTNYMASTGGVGNVTFGPLVITTNTAGAIKMTTVDGATNLIQIIGGPYRAGVAQGPMPKITLFSTNSGSTPGSIVIGGGATGYVGVSAAEYVQIENTRFDENAISNSAGVLTIGKIQMPFWTTGSVALSAGLTNTVTINDAQGQGAINEYWGRLDFRSYWAPPLMVYRLTTNLGSSAWLAQSWWSYDQAWTNALQSNETCYVTLGPHTASKAIYGAGLGAVARGTNDGMHDLILMTSDAATNLAERARVTAEGNFELKGGRFIGDGAGLTNLAVSGSSNPFTNFYVNAVASATNRIQFTVPTNDAWSRIEINLTAYQTNDAAQGYVYFRINGATGTNTLHAYQTMTANNTTISGASGSNDASGAYSGRLWAPHNYSNAASRVTISLHDIYDPYPAKTYFAHNWTKPRTVGGLNQQYIEINYGSVSIGAAVTGIEVLAVGTVFDTGSVLRVRGMP